MKTTRITNAFLFYRHETRSLELELVGEKGGTYTFRLGLDREQMACALRSLLRAFGDRCESEQQLLRSSVTSIARASESAKKQWEDA